MSNRLKQEYEYLWHWLLKKGIFVAVIIVNMFLYLFVAIAIILVKLFSGKH